MSSIKKLTDGEHYRLKRDVIQGIYVDQATMIDQALTVSQITHAIKTQLESGFRSVTIQGEISNFKRQASGHLYFSLKDSTAQISAVMFRGNASKTQKPPSSGDHVVAKGDIQVYPPHGKYQLIVKELTPMGLGELLLKLDALKREIHRRGWFDQEHKKALPKFPKRIGVVTSPTGAVIQDILNVLQRRFSGFHVILNPVRVQGNTAAQEIARAIEEFNQYKLVDVIIVGRGGGSIEDLWAFNEEIVAAAIHHSEIPIIAAIGHETDHTIADYVADVRAPTPSAAAELAISEKEHHLKFLQTSQHRICQAIQHLVTSNRHRLNGILRHPIFASPYALLGSYLQKIDDMQGSLDHIIKEELNRNKLKLNNYKRHIESLNPLSQIANLRQRLKSLSLQIDRASLVHLRSKKDKLKFLIETLQSIDPKRLTKKGYSLLFSEKDGSVIVSTRQLLPEDKVLLMLSDGQVSATVNEIRNSCE